MRQGPKFPRGEWKRSPLRLFEGDTVQVQLDSGDWIAGTLHVFGGGLEVEYIEPRAMSGFVESSRFLDREQARNLRALLRPESLWTDELRVRREAQIWSTAHPKPAQRMVRWWDELLGRDPAAREPVLRRYLGRRILVEVPRRNRQVPVSGLLLDFDADFLALADATLPAENSLPLCPGQTSGADLDVSWDDDGLEVFNRGRLDVEILGIRTSAGTRPWEILLSPGATERLGFRSAPAGTAELLFESHERGDALLPRRGTLIRGGSEGSVSLPALPDPSTLMRDLPIGTTAESREEPRLASAEEARTPVGDYD